MFPERSLLSFDLCSELDDRPEVGICRDALGKYTCLDPILRDSEIVDLIGHISLFTTHPWVLLMCILN